jgi:hypothetical protein
MLLLSFVSYGQEQRYKLKKIKNISYVKEYINDVPKYEKIKPKKINYKEYDDYNSISLGVSPYGNIDIETRTKGKDGIGVDIYHDKVIYPDYFWNVYGTYSQMDKFILNSNKRFGVGVYYITPLKYGFDVSIGGGLLHYYLTTGIPNDFPPTTSVYWVFGFTKEVRITERLHLEGKGFFRNTRKYARDITNRVTNFEPSLGIRYDLKLKHNFKLLR